MTPETVIDILREALWMIVLLASIIIGPGLVIGLVVSTFQACLLYTSPSPRDS